MVAEESFYIGGFGDQRLKDSGAELLSRMVEKNSVCLRRLGRDRAGEMRFGRWLRNTKVTPQEIAREACVKTGKLAAGAHVLALHDTSELNFQARASSTTGLGTVGNGKSSQEELCFVRSKRGKAHCTSSKNGSALWSDRAVISHTQETRIEH